MRGHNRFLPDHQKDSAPTCFRSKRRRNFPPLRLNSLDRAGPSLTSPLILIPTTCRSVDVLSQAVSTAQAPVLPHAGRGTAGRKRPGVIGSPGQKKEAPHSEVASQGFPGDCRTNLQLRTGQELRSRNVYGKSRWCGRERRLVRRAPDTIIAAQFYRSLVFLFFCWHRRVRTRTHHEPAGFEKWW